MHSPLEQYLEQVETRLRDLPAEERQSEVEEMRQHLQDSIESRVELGCSQEEAIAQTLEQFGRAQTVGTELAHVHTRTEAGWRGSLLSAAACAYALGMSFSLLRDGMLPALFFFMGKSGGTILSVSWFLARLVMVPFLTGLTTALFFPRKAVQGIALAYVIVFGFAWIAGSLHLSISGPGLLADMFQVVPSSIIRACRSSTGPLLDSVFQGLYAPLCVQSVILVLISMFIAMSSAKMGVLCQKARQRRMRLA